MSKRLDALYSVLERPNGKSSAYTSEIQQDSYEVLVQDCEVPVASCDLLQNVEESVQSPQNRKEPQTSSVTNLVYSGGEVVDSSAASGETYSQLDHGIVKSLQPKNELTKGHAAEVTKSSQNKKMYICFVGCFVILAVGLVAAVAALVGAFAWMRKLDSELKEITEAEQLLLEQKEKNVNLVNMEVISQSEFQERISNDLTDFKTSIEGIIENLNKTLVNWESQITNLTWIVQQVQYNQTYINNIVQNINVSFTALTNDLNMKIHINLTKTREALLNLISISQAQAMSHRELGNQTSELYKLFQDHLVFDSCASVSSSSPLFSSGQYRIHNPDGSYSLAYCNMTLTCGGLTGGWRRVAYLNLSDQEDNGCPSGFEYHNSMSCRRSSSSAGCSPVAYKTRNISFTQVCGTIIAQVVGTPDGFRNGSIDENDMDNISLTFGSPRNHLWSYPVLHNGNWKDCMKSKPGIVSSHFFCFSPDFSSGMVCSERGCSENWFYRHFEESITHSNIELSVCRSQSRNYEDIHLMHIEIYVQ